MRVFIWFCFLSTVLPSALAKGVAPNDSRSVILDVAQKDSRVSSNLFSHNLEFTRHDLFEGLSAEIVANWQLTVPTGVTIPPRWFMIGNAKVAGRPHESGVECDLLEASVGGECGVGQTQVGGGFDSGMGAGSTLHFQQGRSYMVTIHVDSTARHAASSSVVATLRIVCQDGNIFEKSFTVADDASPTPLVAHFASPYTTANATVTVTARSGQDGTLRLGAVSIMPADAWQGMRTDVISTLSSLGWHGLLRFPGGCFTPFYNWKKALLPPSQRPPVRLPADYCAAVKGGVAAYTDGIISNGFSTDEAAALAKRLGTPLALTIPLQTGSDEEIRSAMEWLEYCNGDASTTMGALRASRGHLEPYGVSVWYLGNEISIQQRYPDANPDAKPIPPPTAAEYTRILEKLVPALLSVEQVTPLKFLVPEGPEGWSSAILSSGVAKYITGISIHQGYYTPPEAATPTEIAKQPSVAFIPWLRKARSALDQESRESRIDISLDEWGLGPPWTVPRGHFNTVFGMWSASFLSNVMKNAAELGITYANYFEAINEGAIDVDMESSSLTSQGEVFALYARHQDGQFVGMSTVDPSDDIDVLATLHEEQGVSILKVSVANRNCTSGQSVRIELAHGLARGDARITVLESRSTSPDSTFQRDDHTVTFHDRSYVNLKTPSCSVVHAEVPIAKPSQQRKEVEWLRKAIV